MNASMCRRLPERSILDARLLVLVLAAAAGCGHATGELPTLPTGPQVPARTIVYAGAFGDGFQAGALALTLAAPGTSAGATVATGTMTTIDGIATPLTGTFDAAGGAVELDGGSYSLVGSLAHGAVDGYTIAHGRTGGFTAAEPAASGAAAAVYCGSFEAPGQFGWLGLAVRGDGTASGYVVVFGGGGTARLRGAFSGGTGTLRLGPSIDIDAAVSADGRTLRGTYAAAQGGLGTITASAGACRPASGTDSTLARAVAGSWAMPAGSFAPLIDFQLLPLDGGMAGAGAITVVPTDGYGGVDGFIITGGRLDADTVSFTASLGANPVGDGTYYRGSLTFTGVRTGATLTGSFTFTPPRTSTRTFPSRTVTGVTLARR